MGKSVFRLSKGKHKIGLSYQEDDAFKGESPNRVNQSTYMIALEELQKIDELNRRNK